MRFHERYCKVIKNFFILSFEKCFKTKKNKSKPYRIGEQIKVIDSKRISMCNKPKIAGKKEKEKEKLFKS